MSIALANRVEDFRLRAESALDRFLPEADTPPKRLHEAMRYTVMGGGKRVRPLLVYLTGETLGVPPGVLDAPACAAEIIHAYSLVHDDLPAMDDDDLRRGRPTLHRAFDEATAILAGDALQVLAFEILSSHGAKSADNASRLAMVRCLAEAAGTHGMAGGQVVDLEATGQKLTVAQIEEMHRLKTGALILACVRMAALCKPALEPAQNGALERFGADIGLAFQIQDDILDVIGDSEQLGKTAGADAALAKATYPGITGLDEAQRRAGELADSAIEALTPFGDAAWPLIELAEYIVSRKR